MQSRGYAGDGADQQGQQHHQGLTSAYSESLRDWKYTDWSVWMDFCRTRQKRTAGPLVMATTRQKAFLARRRIVARVREFVIKFNASYLIARLEHEAIKFENWRVSKQAAAEWGAQ